MGVGDGGVDNGGEEWEDEGGEIVRHGGGKTRVLEGGER